ncbi:dihydrolipoyllysine-residue acetyltransferase component 1 of pyruvate dehydrogenase mitochondrial-like [Stylonychia lemnae]|uniref:Dihydrolipoyllysine-residue acetyltransferase component 1 of pyruvate dehydrogenase mitochondrial-like n=1 Tax=Stylonychia lemnae TaxID=5949 RepID=A0A078AMV9_STYLE|nr:dihydrolipoyllysine-residue acetyltransferase component 1 of pyruvate dehydrogenase mitochondrial-like [Stylonychia lemnae]|eukprot:CDW83261.1 dihydrolipoyllysine-residue acetyltransferase component 1 of pyruvate dehydrogenase mitochondrial-like [Stylonychia lemnae]
MAFRILAKQLLHKQSTKSLALNKASFLWQQNLYQFASVIKLEMPALSPTMSEGNILTWTKKEGDKVNVGDILCEIQTDKATIGFESQEEGYLAKIIVPQDTKQVTVGKLIGLLVEEQAEIAQVDVAKYTQESKPAATSQKQESTSSTSQSQSQPQQSHHDFETEYHKQESSYLIAPSAGFYLKSYQVLPSEVKASGPKNLIQKGDVLSFIKSSNIQKGQKRAVDQSSQNQQQQQASQTQQQTVQKEEKKQTQPQKQQSKGTPNDGTYDRFNIKKQSWKDNTFDSQSKQVAQSIQHSKSNLPHSYLTSTCIVDELLSTLSTYDAKLTLDLFLVKATSKALSKVLKAKNINVSRLVQDNKEKSVIFYQQTDRVNTSQLTSPKSSQQIQGSNFSQDVPQSLVEIYQVSSAAESYAVVNPSSLISLHYTAPQKEVGIDAAHHQLILDIDSLEESNSEVKLKTQQKVKLSMAFDGSKLDEVQAAKVLSLIQRYLSDPDSMML